MKNRTLILGILFFFLAGFYLYNEFLKDNLDTNLIKEIPIISFLDNNKSRIPTRIRLMGAEFNSIDISRASTLNTDSPLIHRAEWILKDPTFAPADQEIVENIIERIKGITGSKFEEEINQTSLGLTPPELILIIDFDDKTKEVISFGTKSTISKKRFIQKEGYPYYFETLKDFPSYIASIKENIKSKKILKINPDIVSAISIIREDQNFKIISKKCLDKEENQKTDWAISTSNGILNGDSDFISRKLKELSNLSVKRIFEMPLEIFSFTGLDNPFLILSFTIQIDEDGNFTCDKTKKKELLLSFGRGLGVRLDESSKIAPDTSYYLSVVGEVRVYEIDKGFFSDWLQEPFHFRKRCPFCELNAEKLDIRSINILNPEKSCSLSLGGDSLNELFNNNITLFESIKSVRFDALLSESEASNYLIENGPQIEILLPNESLKLEVFGKIKNEQENDKLDEEGNTPYVLKVKPESEPVYYGVIAPDIISNLKKSINNACGGAK